MVRVALYGGSFDPPHMGHRGALELLQLSGDFDRILMMPVYEHAFDKPLAPFEHRVKMCEIVARGLSQVEVSRIEAELEPPNYTLNTLRALTERYPDWELRLVVGSDVLAESPHWRSFDEVCRLAPLYPLGRRGHAHANAPPAVLPEVSSSSIRERLRYRTGELATSERLALIEFIEPKILDYIEEHRLYRDDLGKASG